MIRLVSPATLSKTTDRIEQHLLNALRSQNTQALNTAFAFEVTGDDGDLIGGVTASTSYGWVLIKTLWVDPRHQRQGHATALMACVEDQGRVHKCHGMWLDTSSLTAREFYEQLGFEVFGKLENEAHHSPPDHRRWFMRKGVASMPL